MPKTIFHFNPIYCIKESSLEFKRVASCDDDTYFINKQVFGLFFRSTYRIFATYDIQYAHPLDMGG